MRSRVSGVIISVAVAMAMLAIGVGADAQDFAARPSFRVDAAPRAFGGAPALEGYVYNDSLYRIMNVRVKVETLDGNGAVIEEVTGWVMGQIPARGRGYFIVPMTKTASAYRVTVVSFNLVSRDG